MASQSEQDFEQYLQGVEFPVTGDEIVSVARDIVVP